MRPARFVFIGSIAATLALVPLTSSLWAHSAQAHKGTRVGSAAPQDPAPGPQGVSPANPDVKPPDVGDSWICWRCGARNPRPRKLQKGEMPGPMLGPGNDAPRGMGEGHPGFAHHGGRLPSERIIEHAVVLGLSDEQRMRLEELSYQTKQRLIDYRAAEEKDRLELKRMLDMGKDDETGIHRQLGEIAKRHVDVEEAVISNWLDAKKLLNEDQLKMIRDARGGMGDVVD
jgi:hypothetical protein